MAIIYANGFHLYRKYATPINGNWGVSLDSDQASQYNGYSVSSMFDAFYRGSDYNFLVSNSAKSTAVPRSGLLWMNNANDRGSSLTRAAKVLSPQKGGADVVLSFNLRAGSAAPSFAANIIGLSFHSAIPNWSAGGGMNTAFTSGAFFGFSTCSVSRGSYSLPGEGSSTWYAPETSGVFVAGADNQIELMVSPANRSARVYVNSVLTYSYDLPPVWLDVLGKDFAPSLVFCPLAVYAPDSPVSNSSYSNHNGRAVINDLVVSNERLGKIEIVPVYPAADTATRDWTRSGGESNAAMVSQSLNETEVDNAATFVSADTSGDTDLYTVTDSGITAGRKIHGLHVVSRGRRGTDPRSFAPIAALGDAVFVPATATAPASPNRWVDGDALITTAPGTTRALKVSDLADLKIGTRVID